jgi:hypothetical protein
VGLCSPAGLPLEASRQVDDPDSRSTSVAVGRWTTAVRTPQLLWQSRTSLQSACAGLLRHGRRGGAQPPGLGVARCCGTGRRGLAPLRMGAVRGIRLALLDALTRHPRVQVDILSGSFRRHCRQGLGHTTSLYGLGLGSNMDAPASRKEYARGLSREDGPERDHHGHASICLSLGLPGP